MVINNKNNFQKRYLKKGVFVEKTATVNENANIFPGCYIMGNSKIDDGATIFPGSVILDSEIGKNSKIINSIIENSQIKENVNIGPYAHVRPDSIIENDCRIGNFVEIKASSVGKGCKIAHLAYVGNAELGEECNIGCGAIFVNYNGRSKNKTIVGSNCFIGSNCNIIAPVVIEKNSYICAGTTLTKNTKSGDFVIGRAREEIKENRSQKYLKKML